MYSMSVYMYVFVYIYNQTLCATFKQMLNKNENPDEC